MTDPREPIGTSADWITWRVDPLQVDEEPWAVAEDDPRSGMVIVWMLGAIVAALIVAVAWLAWTR
jgi:hypothetical protein